MLTVDWSVVTDSDWSIQIADASMPGFNLPAFQYSYNYTNATDESLTEHTVTFSDIQSALSTGLFIIPLMAYLESISIAKGFAVKNNYKVDATQELVRQDSKCRVKIDIHQSGRSSRLKAYAREFLKWTVQKNENRSLC